ncbi:MAG: hypothetical protein ACFFFT_14010 [Candidatus Thorarchaeota archaeon]
MRSKIREITQIILIFSILIIVFSIFFVPNPSKNEVIYTNENNPNISAEQWSKKTYNIQLIENPNFTSSDNWNSVFNGDLSDIDTNIQNEEAHFIINGEQVTDYEIVSGTINNSLTSQGWINSTNPLIPVYPRRIASEPLHNITEDGCWTAHIWNESSGTPLNPFQKVSAQWDKNVTLLYDMSDYNITSASLKIKVNATVRASPGDGKDPYTLPYPWGGIEVPGDSYSTYFGEGDYVIFYVVLSNIQKNVSYRVAEFKPENLGTDAGPNSYDNITDTIFEPENMDDLIFYLNQVLATDFQNFTISVGVEINCEDNFSSDMDIFEDIYIKTCDFNITYVKKIDQLTTASWKYQGNPLESDNGIIEINKAIVNFEYKINQSWPTILSPNSEIKILINNQEHTETFKLSEASIYFKDVKAAGIDVTKLIPIDEEINLEIQVSLADEFGLAEAYKITIDNVYLEISYDFYTITEVNYLFQILLIIGLIVAGGLAGYFIYYQRVLKYPRAVRKVRKYRRSLSKSNPPTVSVKNQESSFKSQYKKELGKTSNYLKGKPSTPVTASSKSPKKAPIKSGKANVSKKTLLILIILLIGFLVPFIFTNLYSTQTSIKGTFNSNNPIPAQATSWKRESRTAQLIENSDFNNSDNWEYEYNGDATDVNASISNGAANFDIMGNSGTQQWIENNPLSGEWSKIQNVDGIPVPEVDEMRSDGWFVRHRYIDNSLNQSVKAQWQKNFTMEVDMSDYYITSASLDVWINGTVENQDADSGGIDRPGDTDISSGILQMATGDFARFFVLVSDLQHEREFEAINYQTTDLGKDGPPAITELNDTKVIPLTEESLIFYLNQAFEKNSREFALTLGISVWCEDSVYATDRDFWNGLWIKNFTLTISYEKIINQFTSISWEYKGDQLNSEGYRIEVSEAKLYFDYKINSTWPTSLSPNSEFKILINNQVHNETIKLRNAGLSFVAIKEDGFDLTKLIPINESINISIQIFLADEFGLSNIIELSIDNAILDISYVVIIPLEQTLLFQILFILSIIGATILAIYILLYQRILKYPKPVRKVRKYKKTLRRKKGPEIPILNRELAFMGAYRRQMMTTSDYYKGKPKLHKREDISIKPSQSVEQKLEQDQLIEKSIEHKAELDKLIADSDKKL